jgi:hypothetical protein
MSQVRIIVEYSRQDATPLMRWERTAEVPLFAPGTSPAKTDTFELLGRAFEVAQREEGAPFRESLSGFFRGALIRKEDLADVLSHMTDAP